MWRTVRNFNEFKKEILADRIVVKFRLNKVSEILDTIIDTIFVWSTFNLQSLYRCLSGRGPR